MMLMIRGAGSFGTPRQGFGWRGLGAGVLAALVLWAAGIAAARADTPLPPDQRFKSWTMICRKAPLAQEPYCRIYYRVRDAQDKDKVLFIATVQFAGKARTPMMKLTMPAVANLQR